LWKSVYDALPLGTNAQLDQSGHDFGGTNAQESCPVFKAPSDDVSSPAAPKVALSNLVDRALAKAKDRPAGLRASEQVYRLLYRK